MTKEYDTRYVDGGILRKRGAKYVAEVNTRSARKRKSFLTALPTFQLPTSCAIWNPSWMSVSRKRLRYYRAVSHQHGVGAVNTSAPAGPNRPNCTAPTIVGLVS